MHENKTENMPIKYIKISPLSEIRIVVMPLCLCLWLSLPSLSLSSLSPLFPSPSPSLSAVMQQCVTFW